MSYKRLNIKSSIKDIDDAKGIVKIRVSAFNNIDSYGDIMSEKAFNKTISDFNNGKRTRIKHLKNHDWGQLLGIPLEMVATKDGLDVVSKMNLDKTLAKETFSDYKFFADNGDTLEHSIGYTVVKEEKSTEQNANILKEVHLMEYSTLDFLGANSETPLLGLKNANMNQDELIKRIEELESKLKSLEAVNSLQADDKKDDNDLNKLNLNFKF